MHRNHLNRAINRTLRQIKKQKLKRLHSKELHDKIKASDELERLRKKLAILQDESNKLNTTNKDK